MYAHTSVFLAVSSAIAASASLVPFAASCAFTTNGSWQRCWEGTNLGATASNCY